MYFCCSDFTQEPHPNVECLGSDSSLTSSKKRTCLQASLFLLNSLLGVRGAMLGVSMCLTSPGRPSDSWTGTKLLVQYQPWDTRDMQQVSAGVAESDITDRAPRLEAA